MRYWRRFLGCLTAFRDRPAFWLVMVTPGWRGGVLERVWMALLPYAGNWAYRDDPYVIERRQRWIETGDWRP